MSKINLYALQYLINNFKKEILIDKKRIFYISSIIISVIYLLFYYKNVGIHDAGAYINSGNMLINRENPYKSYGAKWGSFGPIILLSFSSIFPKAIIGTAFQFINLFGLYIFFRTYINKSNNSTSFLIFLLVLWLSPIREMLAINQITGIVLGCVALGKKFLPSNMNKQNRFTSYFVSTLFFSIAIDLKPHTIIFLFIVIILFEKSHKLIIYTTIFLLASHITINMYVGSILELDWIRSILKVSLSASENELGDSVSFWPIFNYYLNYSKIFYLASILSVAALFIISLRFSHKKQLDMAIFLALLAPSLSIYYHFYDLIPLCIIVLNWAILNKQYTYSSFILSFILIPKEYLSYKNNLLVFFLLLQLSYLFLRNLKELKTFTLLKIILGVILTYMLHFFNTYLNFNQFLLQSLIVSETLLMIYFVIYLKRKKSSALINMDANVN